jgi:hypothetical protein
MVEVLDYILSVAKFKELQCHLKFLNKGMPLVYVLEKNLFSFEWRNAEGGSKRMNVCLLQIHVES